MLYAVGYKWGVQFISFVTSPAPGSFAVIHHEVQLFDVKGQTSVDAMERIEYDESPVEMFVRENQRDCYACQQSC